MEGRKRGKMKEKGKGEGEEGRGAGREGKGREEARQVSGGKNSRSLARLSWPRMQSRLALLGRTGLATAKPHSSLPLVVADPNFCSRCSSPACTQSSLAASQILSTPHSLLGSHMVRSLRRQQSSCDAYFHTCHFPVTCSHIQIFPIQLDASTVWVSGFLFRSPM